MRRQKIIRVTGWEMRFPRNLVGEKKAAKHENMLAKGEIISNTLGCPVRMNLSGTTARKRLRGMYQR